MPPGGISNPYGCTPIGRIINTVVTLAPGEQTVVSADQTFNCTNVAGALNQTYTINAAVDVHADDGRRLRGLPDPEHGLLQRPGER